MKTNTTLWRRVLTAVIVFSVVVLVIRRIERQMGSIRILDSKDARNSIVQSLHLPVACPLEVYGSFNHGFRNDSYFSRIKETAFPKSVQDVHKGGWWAPVDCRFVNEHIAVIISLDGQESHLETYLSLIHAYLQQQKIPYVIVTIQPAARESLNRGLALNLAVLHLPNRIKCFIFADVNFMPDRLENMFVCDEATPESLITTSTSSFANRSDVDENRKFRGIVAFTREQFFEVNGFSTLYWDSGYEDEDMHNRVLQFYGSVTRLNDSTVGSYTYLGEPKAEGKVIDSDARNEKILLSGYDYSEDGLRNSAEQCTVKNIEENMQRTAITIKCVRPSDEKIEEILQIKF